MTLPETATRHPHDGVRCWTPSLCAADEALVKLRGVLEQNHGDDEAAWGPLVARLDQTLRDQRA